MKKIYVVNPIFILNNNIYYTKENDITQDLKKELYLYYDINSSLKNIDVLENNLYQLKEKNLLEIFLQAEFYKSLYSDIVIFNIKDFELKEIVDVLFCLLLSLYCKKDVIIYLNKNSQLFDSFMLFEFSNISFFTNLKDLIKELKEKRNEY